MADDEQFSLCWNNFNSNLSAGFHESLCRGDLVDVTLAAEGQFVKAHRLVLSVCSPYFRKMFTQMPANQHAFVFLKDVSHTALKDLIQFMYCGEVNVKQEALPAFISTAEALQIKGLTDSDPPASQSPTEPSTPTPQIQPISSPRVRQRTSTSRSFKIESVDDSGDDNKATQIVIQTSAPPPTQQQVIAQPQTQHLQPQTQQSQTHVAPQQIASTPTATTTTVVSHKRPAARSIGSVPHIKRTKSTIDPLDTTDAPTTGSQQITVQTSVVAPSPADTKTQVHQQQHQQQQHHQQQQQQNEPEYIDLPIELPTKSEPDYADDAADVEGGENEATYVEDDSYGELRYDESYFTENDEAGAATSVQQSGGAGTAGSGASATTSKALVKQQQSSSFTDTSYVDVADQANSDAQATTNTGQSPGEELPTVTTASTGINTQATIIGNEIITTSPKRKRGRRPKTPKKDDQRLIDKILVALQNGHGEPAIYASTTKGGMKLIYEGHHFRFTFRRGQYSIFQCCFKENMQECKVRVVCDQKRVYPLDGDHIHFMQATDRSVTSMIFEPDDMDDVLDTIPPTEEEQEQQEDEAVINVYEVEVSESGPEINNSEEYAAEQNEQEDTETVADTDDFREKIKIRLQKALLGKKK